MQPNLGGMASAPYDVVVAGIGGMGSSAAANCAARGVRVLGVEQFPRGHQFGSSSGKTRIIRRAYFEDAAYVPLLDRSYQMWRELEAESGEHVICLDGMLTAGFRGSEVVAGAEAAAKLNDLDVEYWEAKDIRTRYPALRVNDDDYGVFEPDGGFIIPEASVSAYTAVAEKHGAELRYETSLVRWSSDSDILRVELSDGTIVRTSRLILTLGPWFTKTMESLGVAMRVQRNVVAWFKPERPLGPRELPTFLIDRAGLPTRFYGFPDVGDGVKGALHGYGVMTQADELDRQIDMMRDIDPIAHAFEGWAPGSSHTFLDAKACMYSLTPDEHFILDRHPTNSRVVICGGFSGHGFKFVPVIGEIAADLALKGGTDHDISFLSIRRFKEKAHAGH